MAVTAKANSGLRIGTWGRRETIIKERRKLVRGFFSVDLKGKKMSLRYLLSDILNRIAWVQSSYPELISPSTDVLEGYGLSRSFRRDSNSEVINRGVSAATIDRNNRWKAVDKAGASSAKLRMRSHYTDVLV